MLPPNIAAVLRIRDRTDLVCPEEILLRLDSLKIGKIVYNYKTTATPAAGGMSAWRNTKPTRDLGSSHGNHNSHSNNRHGGSWSGGWNNTNPSGGGGQMAIRRVPSESNSFSSPGEEGTPSFRRFRGAPPGTSPEHTPSSQPSPYPAGGRYVSSIVSDKKVEDRIIGHIRSKLNKFSHNNYDAVKSFLEQIMNSGETEFISEFMDLLFTKAASEEAYCELYSRLLLELTDRFPYLRTEIKTIYENFIGIFMEARDVADQGSSDYKKFLEAQEKKKFRKGYSHFLAEIYNKGLLPSDAIEITVAAIMSSLDKLEQDASNTLLVEEYVVSLTKIVLTINEAKTGPIPPYLVNLIDRLNQILKKPKTETPGYTSKARFSLMDIVEALPN
jgi:hypothetical protein